MATIPEFVVVIPARYASERLPGKPLQLIGDRTMLQHVWERATESAAREVIIATDDTRISDAASAFGAVAQMTSRHHTSGTDRIAEVASARNWSDETVIVNLQGDEPLMPATLIDQCASLMVDKTADISTLASPLAEEGHWEDPNVVKVVTDDHGYALYFSRAPIPFAREADDRSVALAAARHHHGLYAYRRAVLARLVAAQPSPIERAERLEQLRALSLGMRIKVGVPTRRPALGVDTMEDLRRAEQALEALR
ncbi:MAG: 3-deoxy-manno-octulosonate cytidylyltransferase [Pseudomonadota bacterium]